MTHCKKQEISIRRHKAAVGYMKNKNPRSEEADRRYHDQQGKRAVQEDVFFDFVRAFDALASCNGVVSKL